MQKYLHTFLIAVVILGAACSNSQSQPTNLSPTEFAERIKQLPSSAVVDVRTPEEYSKGHLQKSQNINWKGSEFDAQISQLDKSKPVFVYCLSGGRSAAAATKMRAQGFKEVYELDGGIIKWRAANLPEASNTAIGMTKQQFDQLTNSDKLVLIDFYADWCAPCKLMEPYLKEIAIDMKDKVQVIRINADDNQALCKELKVDALPVLQLYKNKSLTWKNEGFITKEEVLKQLK